MTMKRLPREADRRFAAHIQKRYAADAEARSYGRRLAAGQLARRYAVNRNPRLGEWVDRYVAYLDVSDRLDHLHSRMAGLRAKAGAGIALGFREEGRLARLGQKAIRLEARVSRLFDELYREIILESQKTARDTPARRFFEELADMVGEPRPDFDVCLATILAEHANELNAWAEEA